ncbi:amino acid/amide ABC transporter substrate-binding protein (HAAT family) [Antricoccus suffuscus]|uniref:Amino acid/amide ABC transporter substrate-binding protein (HAAT family) n=1 Tax=Antricoccus suffuscus TaxID=1629062 RepID=A0A2T0ZZF7_9ACTN|nr:ABC transporter substrate-binding protein [Antricoccus suffuscus]PRZ41732.1 amino acid/amide ABC transporter substrate-binding protein (HAAT family) [Antricoccus suffuscus]
MRKRFAVTATVGVLALAITTGCSTKGGSGGAATTGSDGIKTDYGVSDTEITLGELTDHSGAFKIGGLSVSQGAQVWVDEINAAGGICDRKIKIDSQDMGYHTDKAISLYAAQKDRILGMMQLLGSPMIAALKGQLNSDKILFIPASWASTNLDVETLLMIGASYDVETINGMAFLQKQGLIADGDKVGHIYIDGEYGANALAGSKFYAGKHNMTVVEQKLTATDNDMSATITKMKSEGVKGLMLSTSTAQLGSIVTQAKNQGLDVPMVGNNPSFDAPLMDTPAAAAMDNYYLSNYSVPFADPAMADVAAKFKAQFTDIPNKTVGLGYLSGLLWQGILEEACDAKDLTRDGVIAASKKVTKLETQGITAPLDFSKVGEPSTRATLILKPDASVDGKLVTVQKAEASKEATEYKLPFQK